MDRLTQLQLVLDGLSSQMFTTVGVLQRDAPPRPLNMPSYVVAPSALSERRPATMRGTHATQELDRERGV